MLIGCLLKIVPEQEQRVCFVLRNASADIELEAICPSADSTYYLFLPSCADSGQLLLVSKKVELKIDRTIYCNGDNVSGFVEGKYYSLFITNDSKCDTFKLCILKTEDIPMMNIKINEKSLNQILRKREYEGYASMDLYSSKGDKLYGEKDGYILLKGRGNSTWWRPKKPFLITLETPDTLLGMARGQKWVLLANEMDWSNLHNKIAFDFASTLGMQWTPSCQFVDLYINGRYYGLYLVTEKIELQDTRLNPDQMPQYLLLNDIEETIERSRKPSIPFYRDQRVALMDCRTNGLVQSYLLKDEVLRFKAIITDKDKLSDSVLSKVIDIHSWASRYLIDEATSNGDIWRRSNFIYCSGVPPFKFYGGPVWDYDLAMQSYDEEILIASDFPLRNMFSCPILRQYVDSLYISRGRPYLMWLLNEGLDSLAQTIAMSSYANSIRWQQCAFDATTYLQGKGNKSSIDSLKTFYTKRIQLLDVLFSNTGSVQCISYETTNPDLRGFYSSVLYHHGRTLADYMSSPLLSRDSSAVWVDTATGKYYTIDSVPPMGCRLSLDGPNTYTNEASNTSRDTIEMKKLLSPIVLTALFVLLFIAIAVREIKLCNKD